MTPSPEHLEGEGGVQAARGGYHDRLDVIAREQPGGVRARSGATREHQSALERRRIRVGQGRHPHPWEGRQHSEVYGGSDSAAADDPDADHPPSSHQM